MDFKIARYTKNLALTGSNYPRVKTLETLKKKSSFLVEADFEIGGHVHKQKCHIWGEEIHDKCIHRQL